MRRHSRVASLFLTLFALAAAVGLAPVAGAHDGNASSTDIGAIESNLQRIRELKFKKPVPLRVETVNEVMGFYRREMAETIPDEVLDAQSKIGAMLGMYPPGFNFKAESLKLMKSQIAAFYDVRRKQMVMIAGAKADGAESSSPQVRAFTRHMIMAHELTHALQDQQLDIGEKVTRSEHAHNSDAELALRAVIEGDATLAGFAYIAGMMNDEVADTVTAHLEDLPQVAAASIGKEPETMTAPLLFQYAAGTAFVREAYRRGGWERVNDLYRNPPQSTQQIANPALYFDHPAPPVAVTLDGYQSTLAGWKPIEQDTLGMLTVSLLLRRNCGKDSPFTELANGWAGDRIVTLKRGNEVSALWLIAFRDSTQSARFAGVYGPILDKANTTTAHGIQQSDTLVLVAVGPAAANFNQLAASVWRRSVPRVEQASQQRSWWSEWFGAKPAAAPEVPRLGIRQRLAQAFARWVFKPRKAAFPGLDGAPTVTSRFAGEKLDLSTKFKIPVSPPSSDPSHQTNGSNNAPHERVEQWPN